MSAVFKKEKIKFFKLFQQWEDVHEIANVFNKRVSDHDVNAEARNQLFFKDYNIEHPSHYIS